MLPSHIIRMKTICLESIQSNFVGPDYILSTLRKLITASFGNLLDCTEIQRLFAYMETLLPMVNDPEN